MNIANFRFKGVAVGGTGEAQMTWPQLAVGLTVIGMVIAVTMAFADLKASSTVLAIGQDRIYGEVKEVKILNQSNQERIDSMDQRLQRVERMLKVRP